MDKILKSTQDDEYPMIYRVLTCYNHPRWCRISSINQHPPALRRVEAALPRPTDVIGQHPSQRRAAIRPQ